MMTCFNRVPLAATLKTDHRGVKVEGRRPGGAMALVQVREVGLGPGSTWHCLSTGTKAKVKNFPRHPVP